MRLTFEQFSGLVRYLHERNRAEAQYLAPLPNQLSELLVSNPVSEGLYAQVAHLSALVFGDHWTDVQWFLFDWKPGFAIEYPEVPGQPKKSYTIESLDDYLAYAQAELFSQPKD